MNKIPQRVAVIMAGGAGERFWPLSRQQRPKQLLRLADPDKMLLEEAVERINPLFPIQDIFVITGLSLKQPICDAHLPLVAENVLAEPCKRNTAGALAWTTAVLLSRFGEAAHDIAMAVLTADHQIGEPEIFRKTLHTALQAAVSTNALVTIGIQPTRPETGYGYVERVRHAKPIADANDLPVYYVARFCEKPNIKTAEAFIASGCHYWNSGMFFWRIRSFLHALQSGAPSMAAAIHTMAVQLSHGDAAAAAQTFDGLDNISIDYALMEKAPEILVVPGTFPWDDIGAWDALERIHQSDASGNIAIGDPVLIGSSNCIVYNEPGQEKMAVSVVGVDGLAIVVSNDAILVIPKAKAQEVRKVVERLKELGSSHV